MPQPSIPALPETDTRTRVCFLSGCPSYQSDHSLSKLADFVELHHDVSCEKAFARSRNDLPGLQRLVHNDCLILFAQRLAIDSLQLEPLRDYIACGGPVVALLPPGSAFLKWPGWEAEVLGIRSTGRSYGLPGALVETAPFAEGHPVLQDVPVMRHAGCVTTLPDVDEHSTALLSARIANRLEPVAWVRTHLQNRAFFTTLGQPADFNQPAFLQLLANAIRWAMQR